MSTTLPQITYEPNITIKIDGDELHSSPYINSFYVYRTPFIKAASFSVLTLPLNSDKIFKIDQALKEGKFPELTISLYTLDAFKRSNKHSFEKKEIIYSNIYNVLHMKIRTSVTQQNPITLVSLFLGQISVHQMSLGCSYNKILRDILAIDAIHEFEDYIQSRFGTSFNFKMVGIEDEETNQEKFEQIFIKSSSDLYIPQLLLNNYKPLTSIGYYFFDEFNITAGMVTGTLTCLQDIEKFEEFDVNDYGFDVLQSLRAKGQVQFIDRFDTLRKSMDDSSVYMKNKHGITKINKRTSVKTEVAKIDNDNNKTDLFNNRQISSFSENPNINFQNKESNQHIMIYAPDTFEAAETRYTNLKKFLDETSESVYQFEAYQVHADAIQFNRKYKLDLSDTGTYFVPISIVNVFSRINPNETPVTHTCHFQTIKYKSSSTESI